VQPVYVGTLVAAMIRGQKRCERPAARPALTPIADMSEPSPAPSRKSALSWRRCCRELFFLFFRRRGVGCGCCCGNRAGIGSEKPNRSGDSGHDELSCWCDDAAIEGGASAYVTSACATRR